LSKLIIIVEYTSLQIHRKNYIIKIKNNSSIIDQRMKSLNLADNNGAEYAQKPRTNSQQLFFNVPSGKLPIILKKRDPGWKKK
jgi:hypothetical protein